MAALAFRVRLQPADGGPPRRAVVRARHARHARARLLSGPGDVVIAEPLGPVGTLWRARRPSGSQLRDLYQQLGTCLGVDPHLGSALRTVIGLIAHDGLNLALADTLDALEAGQPLEAALDALAPVLPPDHLAQWRAGAAAGRLPEVLRRLAIVAERGQQGMKRLRQALAYPVIVLVAALVTGWQAAAQQAPVVAGMFHALGAEPPAATRLLLTAHNLARSQPWVPLAVLGGLVLALRALPAAWRAGGGFTRLVETVPPVRRVLFRLALGRSLRPLSLLLRAGVPLPEALSHAAAAAAHPRLTPFWRALNEDLRLRGRPPLAAALHHARPLGPEGARLLALLRLGEQSGDFASVADRLAAIAEEETDDALGTVQALVTPVALGLVGLFIGLLVMATVVPLSRLATVVLPGGG